MAENLFVSESFIGNHSIEPFWEADLLSLTFLPNIYLKESSQEEVKWSMPNNFRGLWLNGIIIGNSKNDLFALIKDYKKFIIGTDYDVEGNAMAYMLYQMLIEFGIKDEAIVRVPLTHEGYVGILPFWKKEEFDWYIQDKYEDEVWKQMSKKTNGGIGMGRRTLLIEDIILYPPDYVQNINESGTSSITYIFKKSIKEK